MADVHDLTPRLLIEIRDELRGVREEQSQMREEQIRMRESFETAITGLSGQVATLAKGVTFGAGESPAGGEQGR